MAQQLKATLSTFLLWQAEYFSHRVWYDDMSFFYFKSYVSLLGELPHVE